MTSVVYSRHLRLKSFYETIDGEELSKNTWSVFQFMNRNKID